MKGNMEKKIIIRKANERGHANHGWLDSHHTFSFANYFDPNHMGFRSLRVINDDRVSGGMGFGTHPHREMEIISYVIDGKLEHKDSMGNGAVIEPGNFQHISAGTGIAHSEFNHEADKEVHFLQIWIEPNKSGLTPSYSEYNLNDNKVENGLTLVGSSNSDEKGMTIHQDVNLYFGDLQQAQEIQYKTKLDRGVWIQMIKGELVVEGNAITTGDGISLENVEEIHLAANQDVEFLLFDLK